MAKHGFKMGGNGKSIVVVPGVDSDAGTMPAIDPAMLAELNAPVEVLPAAMVEGLNADLSVLLADMVAMGDADTSVPGADFGQADTGQGGSVVLDGTGAVEIALTSEPDVIWIDPARVADDDGMSMMLATEVTASMIDVVASEPVVIEPSPFAALVAAYKPVVAQPVTSGDDYVVTSVKMSREMAAFYAQRYADLTGAVMKVAYADGDFGRGADMVFPGAGKRSAVRTVAARTTVDRVVAPAAPKAERDWLAFDGVAQWGDNPASYAKGYVKLWQAITNAGRTLDLDRLQAFDFAGSREDGTGNSGGKMNGSVLRAWIAKVQAGRDAIDAEFGFKLAAD